jgi:hypothetical protein
MIGYHARPGRQLLLFGWLVGLPAVMVETILLSIIRTQPPLRLLTWPCPPFSCIFAWGLFYVWLNCWGGGGGHPELIQNVLAIAYELCA